MGKEAMWVRGRESRGSGVGETQNKTLVRRARAGAKWQCFLYLCISPIGNSSLNSAFQYQ